MAPSKYILVTTPVPLMTPVSICLPTHVPISTIPPSRIRKPISRNRWTRLSLENAFMAMQVYSNRAGQTEIKLGASNGREPLISRNPQQFCRV